MFGGFATGRLWTGRRQGGLDMPHYEFYCERCKKEVTLILSIGERERGRGLSFRDGHRAFLLCTSAVADFHPGVGRVKRERRRASGDR